MSNIITPRQAPECPLCGTTMRTLYTPKGKFYACLMSECMISINAKDLAVNKWDAMKDKPTCPQCGGQMKVFFRIADNYIKAQCPKCRAKGKVVMVERGKVLSPTPDSWSIDPEKLLKEDK